MRERRNQKEIFTRLVCGTVIAGLIVYALFEDNQEQTRLDNCEVTIHQEKGFGEAKIYQKLDSMSHTFVAVLSCVDRHATVLVFSGVDRTPLFSKQIEYSDLRPLQLFWKDDELSVDFFDDVSGQHILSQVWRWTPATNKA